MDNVQMIKNLLSDNHIQVLLRAMKCVNDVYLLSCLRLCL